MSAEPTPSSPRSAAWAALERDVADALDRARTALRSPDAPLDGVVWASAHLAAFERAVLPVVRRVIGDGRAAVAAVRRHATRLEGVLRMLERRETGDVLAAQMDEERLCRELVDLLTEHARMERVLLVRLGDRLNAAEQDALAAAYRRALEHAPTRPHPHVPHSGPLGALAFRVDAVRDRLMDVMDARHVPAPRATHDRVAPGRWGLWLLGQQRPERGIDEKSATLH